MCREGSRSSQAEPCEGVPTHLQSVDEIDGSGDGDKFFLAGFGDHLGNLVSQNLGTESDDRSTISAEMGTLDDEQGRTSTSERHSAARRMTRLQEYHVLGRQHHGDRKRG